jgi:hypothetical protein
MIPMLTARRFEQVKIEQRFYFASAWWVKTSAAQARKVRTNSVERFPLLAYVEV